MVYIIARMITLPIVAIGSAWLVARYRALGVAISVLAGWGILYFVYHAWPVPPGEWDEDGEEIHYTAPILMLIWCLPVWAIVSLWSFAKRRGDRHGEAQGTK